MSKPDSEVEPTIDWLIDQIAPNEGNSPLLNFNKERLKKLIHTKTVEARQQLKANVFVQFREAMLKQDLSARPPKGARFRTPLEELTLILEREAPLSELQKAKETT